MRRLQVRGIALALLGTMSLVLVVVVLLVARHEPGNVPRGDDSPGAESGCGIVAEPGAREGQDAEPGTHADETARVATEHERGGEGLLIRGYVTAPDESGLTTCRVVATARDAGRIPGSDQVAPAARCVECDARVPGDFSLSGLPVARELILQAWAEAWTTGDVVVENREGAALVDTGILRLRPGCTLSGTVMTEDGQPISGVEILVNRRVVAESDACGSFRAVGLSEGVASVSARSSRFVVGPTREVGLLPDGGETRTHFVGKAGQNVGAFVTDEFGMPVARANVVVCGLKSNDGESARTDEEGWASVLIDGDPPYSVGASLLGYVASRQVRAEPGTTARLMLGAGRGFLVSCSRAGSPEEVWPERVWAQKWNGSRKAHLEYWSAAVKESVHGIFVPFRRPGSYRILASKGELTGSITQDVTGETEEPVRRPVHLVLEKKESVAVVVVDRATGNGILGVSVRFDATGENGWTGMVDDKGSVQIPCEAFGARSSGDLSVWANGWASRKDIVVGRDDDVVRVEMERGCRLEGLVMGKEGMPVAHAHVVLVLEDGSVRHAQSDAGGCFACEALPAVPCFALATRSRQDAVEALQARKARGQDGSSGGESWLAIEDLSPDQVARCELRLLDEDEEGVVFQVLENGRGVGDYQLFLERPGAEEFWLPVRDDGCAYARGVGTHDVDVTLLRYGDLLVAQKRVSMAGRSPGRVVLEIPVGTICGRVVFGAGQPGVASGSVSVLVKRGDGSGQWEYMAGAYPDASGEFECVRVPAGEVRIEFTGSDDAHVKAERTVTLARGERLDVGCIDVEGVGP
ncbi:MAG: hypothetical protein HY812_07235 [Planctomycetes bacterium]|nr:hypothetical protein [Planctomycetota bacterium]